MEEIIKIDRMTEESFTMVRNEWQRTPLERIQETMEKVKHQITIENQNLKYLTDSAERKRLQLKIDDLQRTLIVHRWRLTFEAFFFRQKKCKSKL